MNVVIERGWGGGIVFFPLQRSRYRSWDPFRYRYGTEFSSFRNKFAKSTFQPCSDMLLSLSQSNKLMCFSLLIFCNKKVIITNILTSSSLSRLGRWRAGVRPDALRLAAIVQYSNTAFTHSLVNLNDYAPRLIFLWQWQWSWSMLRVLCSMFRSKFCSMFHVMLPCFISHSSCYMFNVKCFP